MKSISNKSELKDWMIDLVYDQCFNCEYSDACCSDCMSVRDRLAEVTEVIKHIRIEGEEE